MSHSKEQLINDLRELGICAGDTVLMHSSYKSLGGIDGGAKAFFEAFTQLLGAKGTLILPSLSFRFVRRETPEFDYYETPSCSGYLTEYFRTSVEGVLRSMHPTHSCCALGKHAKEIVENHELDLTPVGENSPFTKLPKYDGKILFLGCGTAPNTSMHGVEETAEPPYCIDRENPIDYVLKKGDTVIKQRAFRHNFNTKDGHVNQCYSRIVDLLDENEVKFGKVLDAECCIMDAKAVWEKGHNMLVKDPLYFVDYPEKTEE